MPFAAFFVAFLLLLCIPRRSRKLAVCLLLRVVWSFLADSFGVDIVSLGTTLPDLSGILLSFLVECGVYAVLHLVLRAEDGEPVSI